MRKTYELQTPVTNREKPLINKVLVAVDGSENSEKALDFALDLAEKYSASVLILNVFQLPAFTGYPDEPITNQANMTSVIKDLRKVHETVLARAEAKAIKMKPNLNISTNLKEGEPASQIVKVADEGNFDIIVIGHGGWGRIREFFLGSTSERVAHQASCAVLIVK
jgi:nucleotide-binding universal stress UspA family protein